MAAVRVEWRHRREFGDLPRLICYCEAEATGVDVSKRISMISLWRITTSRGI